MIQEIWTARGDSAKFVTGEDLERLEEYGTPYENTARERREIESTRPSWDIRNTFSPEDVNYRLIWKIYGEYQLLATEGLEEEFGILFHP